MKFVYSIYIQTTPEKLWEALLQPAFTRQYWSGVHMESTFEAGADWRLMIPDGRVGDSGIVLEAERPRKLVVTWENQFIPELKAEGISCCTFELVPEGDLVKLTILHEMEKDESKLIVAVSQGWPKILSSLKTLLETGKPLPGTSEWPKDI
ncbi:MAG TPA: SRPBCC family protein [Acidobacteriaceae bacterium]|jgi:uncharacterized protein YndB with AHSA1/START domain